MQEWVSERERGFFKWCVNYLEENPNTTGYDVVNGYTEYVGKDKHEILSKEI